MEWDEAGNLVKEETYPVHKPRGVEVDEQYKSPDWLSNVQLSGTFRLGGKGFASLTTPRGNFWVEEGKFSSGYKLIELDTSKSQPSALIQKGDQQAWIGFRTGIVPSTREVRTGNLRMRGGLYYARGDKEPFNGKQITPRSDGSKWLEMPYVNGKRHGKRIWYDDDGRIWSETPYVAVSYTHLTLPTTTIV